MARVIISETGADQRPTFSAKPAMVMVSSLPNLLLPLIFAIDLLTPLPIWKGYLPSIIRWSSDLAVVAILAILLLRMLAFDQFPIGFWLIIGLSALTMTQASLQGQPFVTTLWGWWRTFQLPLFAVFAYLNPHWPKNFSQHLRQICVGLLAFETLVQILQYATGEPIGDNLAGTFGRNGVSPLLIFSVLTLSLTLGYGISHSDWRSFVFAFAVGIISSTLAENKIFPVVTVLLTFLAAGFYVWLGGKLFKLLPYIGLLLLGLLLFFFTYNLLVPAAERRPLEQFLFDEGTRETYNQNIRVAQDGGVGTYDIGRNFAMEFGWNFIRTHPDPTVLLYGLGLGAKTESVSLGIIGIAYQQDGLGITPPTGIMVLLQEMGLIGVVVVGIFIATIAYQLLRDLKAYRHSPATQLRAGLLLFTLLWPIWLWYKPFLWYRDSMLLYWVAIGYVLHQRRYDRQVALNE